MYDDEWNYALKASEQIFALILKGYLFNSTFKATGIYSASEFGICNHTPLRPFSFQYANDAKSNKNLYKLNWKKQYVEIFQYWRCKFIIPIKEGSNKSQFAGEGSALSLIIIPLYLSSVPSSLFISIVF